MESSSTSPAILEKTCQHCGKILRGRSDQKFCHDECRNTYNRIKRKAEKIADHGNTPEIFRAISRNYELLKSLKPSKEPDTHIWIEDNSEILRQGFNPKFFTSILTDGQETWHCIFEYGFIIGERSMSVSWFPMQAEL